eukprot:CAMPEP_0170477028 /NCGR_PEP_ID=MMETSP0123-20130129/18357_1 /TAXON_ID=182087 /ORGANISM="Favella ehrenbergii, Strain Fehren 1" /LENGTH=144 /DNA_ID=CAMNT_0010748485 /DNA_START=57 /DNA_END=491 /DNA_ORIENTATION=-
MPRKHQSLSRRANLRKRPLSGKNLKVIQDESESDALQGVVSGVKIGRTAPIKSLDESYGSKSNALSTSKSMVLQKFDRATAGAESAIESLFFTYEEQEKADGEAGESDLVTIDTSQTGLQSGLTFSEAGQDKRKLTFEKDSMAL